MGEPWDLPKKRGFELDHVLKLGGAGWCANGLAPRRVGRSKPPPLPGWTMSIWTPTAPSFRRVVVRSHSSPLRELLADPGASADPGYPQVASRSSPGEARSTARPTSCFSATLGRRSALQLGSGCRRGPHPASAGLLRRVVRTVAADLHALGSRGLPRLRHVRWPLAFVRRAARRAKAHTERDRGRV